MNGRRRRDNVEPIPVRLDLPLEIAAVALPQDEEQPPIVVLNANEADQRAVFTLFRLNTLIGAGIAWIGSKASHWARSHQIAAATITATATSVAAATGVGLALDGDRMPSALPQQTITIVSTQPAVIAATPTPTGSLATGKPTPKASPSEDPTIEPVVLTERPAPTGSHKPTAQPTSKPTAKRTSKPTTQPTTKPSATSEPTGPPTEDPPPTRTPAAPSPTSEPSPATPPATEDPDSTPQATRCTIRVDLDPILDVCVLS